MACQCEKESARFSSLPSVLGRPGIVRRYRTECGSFDYLQWFPDGNKAHLFRLEKRSRITTWAIVTGGYLMLLPFVLSELFTAFNHAMLTVRIAICVASITPGGLLLGFAFPTGMRLIAAIDSRPTPWFWGINGAAGVLASISAIAISLALGITTTLTVRSIMLFPAHSCRLSFGPTQNFSRSPKQSNFPKSWLDRQSVKV